MNLIEANWLKACERGPASLKSPAASALVSNCIVVRASEAPFLSLEPFK